MKKIESFVLFLCVILGALFFLSSCSQDTSPDETYPDNNYDYELADEIKAVVLSNLPSSYNPDELLVFVKKENSITDISVTVQYGYSGYQTWECFKSIYPFMENFNEDYMLSVCTIIDPNGEPRMIKYDTSDLKTGTLFGNDKNNIYKTDVTIGELYEFCNWGTIGVHSDEITTLF